MNWTQVDIYTTTDGIDLLCSDLMDLGIRGFSIQDAEDFNEFLQNKDGKWDYIDEDLMGLSHCESCVTIYLPEDAQGAETLQMVQELLKQRKKRNRLRERNHLKKRNRMKKRHLKQLLQGVSHIRSWMLSVCFRILNCQQGVR